MPNKIRYVTSDGRIDYAEKPSIKPLNINGEEGFGVYHSPITVIPTDVYKPLDIKPRFFSEEVADLRDAEEIRRRQKYVKFATDKTWDAVRDALKYAPIAIPGVATLNNDVINNTTNKQKHERFQD